MVKALSVSSMSTGSRKSDESFAARTRCAPWGTSRMREGGCCSGRSRVATRGSDFALGNSPGKRESCRMAEEHSSRPSCASFKPMIAFAPEEDERLLVDSARAFAREMLRPHLRAFEEARAVPEEVRRAFHELGLVGMDLPSELGFAGVSLTTRALAEEELAAGDLGAAVALDAIGPAAEVLRRFDARRWLSPFLDDPLRRAAFAVPDLRFVPGGAQAQIVVTADAVCTDFSAVEDRDVLGLAELPPAALTLRSAGEPLAAPPKADSGDAVGLCDARDAVRAALFRHAGVTSARAVGSARAAFDHARRYADERTAFGKPIGHFQSIAFWLPPMPPDIDAALA